MKSLSFLILISFFSCASQKPQEKFSLSEEAILATNWFQVSGEARALYLQGYNLAKLMLRESLKRKSSKPRAVIVDIDETVLDNSPYQGKLIKEKANYPKYWREWVELRSAEALPGSLEFLKYADENGVKIFYITNRKEEDRVATFDNLKRLGFPVKEAAEIMVQTGRSNKTERRDIVRNTYQVVVLVGDNLNDFDGAFEKESNKNKNAIVDQRKYEFGEKFIMMPNPLYGDWEGAIYNYNYGASDEDKHDMRIKALKSF